MKNSNYKIVFNSRDSIGKSVVDKKGRVNTASQNRSGVYQIPCSQGCDKTYYGRTLKPLYLRLREHKKHLDKKTPLQAHVEHLKLHPDHNFDLSAASLIWRSNNEYECQFVEAACITSLTNCNISKGDVKLFPPIASLVSNIAVSHKSKRNRNNNGPQRNSLYVPPLIADVPLLPSTSTADISMSGNSPSLSSTTSTPPVTQPHPFSLRMTPSPHPTTSPPLPDVFSYATQLTSPTGSMALPSTGSILSPSQLTLLPSPVRLPDLHHSDLTPRIAPLHPRP